MRDRSGNSCFWRGSPQFSALQPRQPSGPPPFFVRKPAGRRSPQWRRGRAERLRVGQPGASFQRVMPPPTLRTTPVLRPPLLGAPGQHESPPPPLVFACLSGARGSMASRNATLTLCRAVPRPAPMVAAPFCNGEIGPRGRHHLICMANNPPAGACLVPHIPRGPGRRAGVSGWCRQHVNRSAASHQHPRHPAHRHRPSSAIPQPPSTSYIAVAGPLLLALAPQQLIELFESKIRRGLVDAAERDREPSGSGMFSFRFRKRQCEPPDWLTALAPGQPFNGLTIPFPIPGSSGTPEARVCIPAASPCHLPCALAPGRRAACPCRAMSPL